MSSQHEKSVYPGIIPYPTPSPSEAGSSESGSAGTGNVANFRMNKQKLPRLLGIKKNESVSIRKPLVSTSSNSDKNSSFNASTAEFRESLKEAKSEEELRNKYFDYWEKEQQKVGPKTLFSIGTLSESSQ